jgi:fluoroquinolone transport system permease protein
MRWDVLIQYRNKFYAVSGFVVVFWTALLMFASGGIQLDPALVVPMFVAINLVITTFYFMAALVLLERNEGTFTALVVSPLRDVEYLLSKSISLSILALLETLIVVVVIFGINASWLPLLFGSLLFGVFYSLVGFISVSRYGAINEFLIPSAGIVTLMFVPLAGYFKLVDPMVFILHPVQPFIVLLQSAYTQMDVWQVAYAYLGSVAWTVLAFIWARRRFTILRSKHQ